MKKVLTSFAILAIAIFSFSGCTQYNYRHRDYSYERHHHYDRGRHYDEHTSRSRDWDDHRDK